MNSICVSFHSYHIMTQIPWMVGMQCVHNIRLLQYYWMASSLGAPLGIPGLTGIQIILTILCEVRIHSVSVSNVYMYTFKSFGLNLSMAHCASFSKLYKLACYQMVYDNWHTITCMFAEVLTVSKLS